MDKSWNPIDTSYSNCPLLPWKQMGWRQRIMAAVFNVIAWGFIFPAMLIAMLAFIGMMFEGIATQSEQLDRCKRQAVTPYEFHQCR